MHGFFSAGSGLISMYEMLRVNKKKWMIIKKTEQSRRKAK